MMTASKLAKILYADDLSRADRVPVEPDGSKAYDNWERAAGAAGDEKTAADLAAVDWASFVEAWEALVEQEAVDLTFQIAGLEDQAQNAEDREWLDRASKIRASIRPLAARLSALRAVRS